MATAGGAVVGLFAGPALVSANGARAVPLPRAAVPLPTGLFTLGVASGEPTPHGVVLWTRLAPTPTTGGGMPDVPVDVRWEVADDDRFTRIRRSGVTTATSALAHSVHAEVGSLLPGRQYFYRFRVGGEVSTVGRTRTAPGPNQSVSRLRFAYASCQDWQSGAYTAYPHLVDEDPEFVVFLGDYIYETATWPQAYRAHVGPGEAVSLTHYRNRYAQYRTDPALRAAHAAAPWIVTLDDHEVDDNFADEVPQDPDRQSRTAFVARRAAAFQAYYEHMPLRRSSLPTGLDMRLYRRLDWGTLAAFHVLDTRQYRSDQPTTLTAANDPTRTMTGAEQESWLVSGLGRRMYRWNLIANQAMMAAHDQTAGPARTYIMDCWDGYRVQRRRLLDLLRTSQVRNPVVLTGDRHATWVCDLRADFDDPSSPVVAAELTGTSVTSGGDADRVAFHAQYDPIMAESPHWKYIDKRRGYMMCDLTADRLSTRLRVVDTVWAPIAGIATAAEFRVTSGRPGVDVVSHDGPPPAGAPPTTARYTVPDDQF
jgi:alkaline phosphatase D